MEKVNDKKIDLIPITTDFLDTNLLLTTQNIVLTFQRNREVSRACRGRRINNVYLSVVQGESENP